MSETTDMPVDTCDRCQHWHLQPADPMNLGAQKHGECRACPPQVTRLPTQRGLQIVSGYPLTPAGYLACGHFLVREEESLRRQHDLEFAFRRYLYDLASSAIAQGEQRLAAGYAWLADQHKYPQRGHDGLYSWASQEYPEPGPDGGKANHCLPPGAMANLRRSGITANQEGQEACWRRSLAAAFAQAAQAVGQWLSETPAEG